MCIHVAEEGFDRLGSDQCLHTSATAAHRKLPSVVLVLEIRIYLSRKRTVLRASVTAGAHGSVGGAASSATVPAASHPYRRCELDDPPPPRRIACAIAASNSASSSAAAWHRAKTSVHCAASALEHYQHR